MALQSDHIEDFVFCFIYFCLHMFVINILQSCDLEEIGNIMVESLQQYSISLLCAFQKKNVRPGRSTERKEDSAEQSGTHTVIRG